MAQLKHHQIDEWHASFDRSFCWRPHLRVVGADRNCLGITSPGSVNRTPPDVYWQLLLVHPIQHFPSVDHWRNSTCTLGASAPLGCDISRYHRISAHQWSIEESNQHARMYTSRTSSSTSSSLYRSRIARWALCAASVYGISIRLFRPLRPFLGERVRIPPKSHFN